MANTADPRLVSIASRLQAAAPLARETKIVVDILLAETAANIAFAAGHAVKLGYPAAHRAALAEAAALFSTPAADVALEPIRADGGPGITEREEFASLFQGMTSPYLEGMRGTRVS